MLQKFYKKPNQTDLCQFRHQQEDVDSLRMLLKSLVRREAIKHRISNPTYLENLILDSVDVGSQPFYADYYQESPVIKGLNEAEEVVLIFNNPIGDTVLTLPLLFAIEEYFSLTNKQTQITLLVKLPKIYKGLKENFRENTRVLKYSSKENKIEGGCLNKNSRKYVINVNRYFNDYEELLGIPGDQVTNPEYVIDILWRNWSKEYSEVQQTPVIYQSIGERITRNVEILLGTKIFQSPRYFSTYFSKIDPSYEQSVLSRHSLDDSKKFIAFSVGSSEYAKEYAPEKWSDVLIEISRSYPEIEIIYLKEPVVFDAEKTSPQEHYEEYEKVFKDLRGKDVRIRTVDESLENLTPILAKALLTITPDTGIGHLSAALGTPNVMLFFAADPYIWSLPCTCPVIHPVALRTHQQDLGTYRWIWKQSIKDYLVPDIDGELIGASQIDPELVLKEVKQVLSRYV